MFGDDQQRNNGLHGNKKCRLLALHQKPRKDGTAGRAQNRGQRYKPAERENDAKDGNSCQGGQRCGHEKHTEAGGHTGQVASLPLIVIGVLPPLIVSVPVPAPLSSSRYSVSSAPELRQVKYV